MPTQDGGVVWVIANPIAGSGRGSRHASVVINALHSAGIACRLVTPSSVEATHNATAQAVASDARAVLACGGDGTVHVVLQEIVHTTIPFGIVAGGSGDDIAASLGFPVHGGPAIAEHVVNAISLGRTRQVDVGTVTCADGSTEYFVGVLSTGFDSAVNERANRMARLGGQRYNVAILRELASFKPVAYDVVIDGERIQGEGMLVAIGNGHRYGGGMLVCPSAKPDDGILDVTWLGAVSTPTFLRALPSVYKGTHVTKSFVTTYRGRSLTIDAAAQIAYADGERVGPLPIAVEALPGVLRVLGG
ncbi:MAG: diacylglycerol kinase family protein [Actinomycetes bacterium]